jgi:hypothetical protein
MKSAKIALINAFYGDWHPDGGDLNFGKCDIQQILQNIKQKKTGET